MSWRVKRKVNLQPALEMSDAFYVYTVSHAERKQKLDIWNTNNRGINATQVVIH